MAAEENREKFDITLNYNGIDIQATVDFETANKLLNDPDEARKYAEMILNVAPTHSSSECGTSSSEIWSTKRPSDGDHEATMFFLQLREKYSQKFNDKKTLKNTLWRKIASEMNEAGYWVGEGKEGAQKCRQKFANMQRTYLHHISAVKRTGEEKKEPPLYLAEMHGILGAKNKINPPYLEDSMSSLSTDQEEDKTDKNSSINNTKVIRNRFLCGAGHKKKK